MMRFVLPCVALIGFSAAAQVLTRGPYLQLGSATGMTVVFRTDRPGFARVRFGPEGLGLTSSVSDHVAQSEHVFRLTGLTPGTRYAYALELDGEPLFTPSPLRFRTHSLPGVSEAFRLFAWGDSGTGTPAQFRVAQRMANELNGAALALILGDIIYVDGHPSDYDPKFFRPYAPLTSQLVIWPVVGNHDVMFDPTGQPWIDAFHTPANNPLFSELFYSFDYGNAHVVVLDTHVNSYAADSLQMRWAAADLAASTARWKIVAFHVPPFSGGTHADDAAVQAGILPALEAAGVDLVLCGHSHVYERTFLLSQGAIVQGDRSSYSKQGAVGTLYVVSGTAGQSGGLSNPAHPLMAFQLGGTLGVSVLDFADDTVRGSFLRDDGSTVDAFQLSKGADVRAPRLVGARAITPTLIEAAFDEPVVEGSMSQGAERAVAWTITPTIAISAAKLGSDLRTVRLTTEPHRGGSYQLSAAGIADRALPPNVSGTESVTYSVRFAVDAGGLPALAPLVDAGVLLVGPQTPLHYLQGAPPSGWEGLDFDDRSWPLGFFPIGYGELGLQTTVAMGDDLTLVTRQSFDLELDPSAVNSLTLEVDFDDAFVASLNGAELARRGLPPVRTSRTPGEVHESGLVEVISIDPTRTLLRPGANVLTFEVHNASTASSDLWLDARLWANASIEGSDGGGRPNDDVDGGVGDAGVEDADAGVDGGHDGSIIPRSPPCGCQLAGTPLGLVGLVVLRGRRRRS